MTLLGPIKNLDSAGLASYVVTQTSGELFKRGVRSQYLCEVPLLVANSNSSDVEIKVENAVRLLNGTGVLKASFDGRLVRVGFAEEASSKTFDPKYLLDSINKLAANVVVDDSRAPKKLTLSHVEVLERARELSMQKNFKSMAMGS